MLLRPLGAAWLGFFALLAVSCGPDPLAVSSLPPHSGPSSSPLVPDKQTNLGHIDSTPTTGSGHQIGAARTLAKPKVGAQVLVEQSFAMLAGDKVAAVLNQASLVGDQPLLDLMAASDRFELVALYAPEHGVRGDAPAGAEVQDITDPSTGTPVISLYHPGQDDPVLDPSVDTVVFDLQDVGVRTYTYISTMGSAMAMAAQAGARFVVLDRPNPLGGQLVSGYGRAPGYESLVGRYPIPFLHSMTIGEMALAVKGEGWIPGLDDLELEVVAMDGWRRSDRWSDTGLKWVAPSPGLPRLASVDAYPATVLFEATTLSVGRGTPEPFSVVGAPWIDQARLVHDMNSRNLAGVRFEPVSFIPRGEPSAPAPPFEGQTVNGLRIEVTDPATYLPVAVAVHLLDAVAGQAGGVGLVIDRPGLFDRLAGTDQLRKIIEQGLPGDGPEVMWSSDVAAFESVRSKYLLYPK